MGKTKTFETQRNGGSGGWATQVDLNRPVGEWFKARLPGYRHLFSRARAWPW